LTVILHTLNASPSSAAFADCLRVLRAGDALVLMGNGIYAAIADTQACNDLRATGAELFVLATDAAVAGISATAEDVTPLDMSELVILTERFPRQQAWY
jgi:tRNA 2-thiouridine synthesizing protein B